MSKKVLVVIIILVILGIVALIFFLPYLQTTPNAVLEIEKGTVEINTGSGWNAASSGTELKQGWQIRTGSDGEANIIFLGNSVARLSNDSEVSIKELKLVEKQLQVRLEQMRGDVWHSISPVSGISSYVVETPFGNFTEVGTSFGISIGTEGMKLAVVSGFVSGTGTPAMERRLVIPFRMQMEIFSGKPVKIVTLEENSWVQKNKKADDDWLVKHREELKKKYSNNLRIAKSLGSQVLKKEITDEFINDAIDRYLRGEIDVPKLVEEGKVPKQIVPLIPGEFLSPPLNVNATNESILDELPKHVKEAPMKSDYVPRNYKHASEEGRDIYGIRRDKSEYVPGDWNHASEEGPDKSKYFPAIYAYVHVSEEGPDKSRYVWPDWRHAFLEGPDKSRYVPPDYKHVSGVDKSKYVPPDWRHASEEGPDKSKYVHPDWIHDKEFDKSKYKYIPGISETEAPTPTPPTNRP